MSISPLPVNLSAPVSFPITITLLGEFRVTVNGQTVNAFRSNKARALLAYLLLNHPRPVARATISHLLWSEYTSASAQINLRQSLTNLRHLFAPFPLLEANYQQIRLNLDPATVWCDANAFTTLVEACRQHEHRSLADCTLCLARLQEAVALAQGGLLENLLATGSAPFDAWLADQRDRFAAALAEAQAVLKARPPLGNLPPPLTPFVGRAIERVDLSAKLQHPIFRCVSLVGLGGIGKTRLACTVGEQMLHHFPDGVWLVELSALAPTTTAETSEQLQNRLATALALALGVNLQGAKPPAVQVTNYLADKTALLIFDSFEHLSPGAAWLPVLLTAAPRLRLLITTRHRLALQSQLVLPLQGLVVPPEEVAGVASADELIAHYASLQLFVERAESVHLPVLRDAPTLTTISQLCRFVDGSPWAIELAVSLLDQQSPATILHALQSNYRALATELLDVPTRQRSAEAIFQTAWQLLTPLEAQTLAHCAVFRGSFTLEAAQTVAAATPATLEALVQKSLLAPSGAERYVLHDLVRQFAAEQLTQSPQVQSALLARHAAYYIDLLQGQESELPSNVDALKKLQNELDNIRTAWRWSTEQGKLALLEKGAASLQDFYRLTGIYAEALQRLDAALSTVRQAIALSPTVNGSPVLVDGVDALRLLARLLCYIAQFYRLYRRTEEVQKGEAYAKEALALGQHLADSALQGLAYHELARLADAQTDYAAMALLAAQGCTQARQANLPQLTAECLNDLGIAVGTSTQPLAGIPHFQEALTCLRQQPNRFLEVRTIANVGFFYFSEHQYGLAHHYLLQVRTLQQPLQLLTHINFGDLLTALGAYPEAQQEYAQGLALVQARRTVYWEGWLRTSYGRLQHLRGDPAAAQITCRLAWQIAQAEGQRFMGQWALINLGHACADVGELAEAAHCYRQAIAAHKADNWLFRLPDAHAGLAAVLLAQNEPVTALTHAETALALLTQQGLAAAGEPFGVYWTCLRVFTTVGDARTQSVLATAYAALQECAMQLADAALRQSFLQTVATNRNLVEAAQAAKLPTYLA